MIKTFTITESKAQLSPLVEHVLSSGDPVSIGRGRKPMVQIVRYSPPRKELSRTGAFVGKIEMARDYERWNREESKALGLND